MIKGAVSRNGEVLNGGKFYFTMVNKVPGMGK
jgi:hypothetical protein